MKQPWTAGRPLSDKDWKDYQRRLLLESAARDIEPGEYFLPARFPLLMEAEEWHAVSRLAQKLAVEALAAEEELLLRPDLHERLGLSKAVMDALRGCGRRNSPRGSARIMRCDFHFTAEGWRISEVNTDFLGGYFEASSLTKLMATYYPQCSPPPDPAGLYARAIRRAVGESALVGIVRRPSIARYRGLKAVAHEIRRQGMRAAMVSPRKVRWKSNFARVAESTSASLPDLLIRWVNATLLPSLLPTPQWTPWYCGGKTPMSNPASCVLTQSKRFPLVWVEMHTPMPNWRSLLPETRCANELSPSSADEWVFKGFYGAAGNEVAIAGITEKQAYQAMLKMVRRRPDKWIAQRRFESTPLNTESGPRHVCLGIYTVDGRVAGAYGRMAPQPLVDGYAEDIVFLIRGKE